MSDKNVVMRTFITYQVELTSKINYTEKVDYFFLVTDYLKVL